MDFNGVHLQRALGPSSMVQRANWTISNLSQMGVRIPSGNRLQKAKQLIEKYNSPAFILRPEDEVLQGRIIDAYKSIAEQHIIVRCFVACNRQIEEKVKFKLEEMLSGSENEEEDKNSKARDTQFELYVASMLMMGGVFIKFDEPDLHLYYGDEFVGVAIKRLKCINQLEKRVKDGVDQIEKSGVRGFIAINLDTFLKKERLVGEDAERVAQVDESNAPVIKLEPLLESNPMIIGVLGFESSASWIFGEGKPKMDISNFQRFVSYSSDLKEKEFGKAFLNNLISNIRERLGTL